MSRGGWAEQQPSRIFTDRTQFPLWKESRCKLIVNSLLDNTDLLPEQIRGEKGDGETTNNEEEGWGRFVRSADPGGRWRFVAKPQQRTICCEENQVPERSAWLGGPGRLICNCPFLPPLPLPPWYQIKTIKARLNRKLLLTVYFIYISVESL